MDNLLVHEALQCGLSITLVLSFQIRSIFVSVLLYQFVCFVCG